MLYIDSKIDYALLTEWINTWDEKIYLSFLNKHYADKGFQFDDSFFIRNIQHVKELSRELKDQFNLNLLNSLLIECFFKFDRASMKIANVFETIILPSDIKTKKRMFKGFDNNYYETGSINLFNSEKAIGNIGKVSDRYFTVFYKNFTTEVKKRDDIEREEFEEIVHAHIVDDYLSIKIWDPAIKDYNNTIEQILYLLSKNYNLKFKRATFSPLQMTEGEVIYEDMKLPQENIEQTPLLFYNSANYSTVPRLRFLSYYQAIEYYFVQASNMLLQRDLIDANITDLNSVDYKKINKAINKYQKSKKEKESLKLVLERAITKDIFICRCIH